MPETVIRFHLSINVSDLSRSVDFYRKLFDVAPAKHYARYAKFELMRPPLVLSLEPSPHARGGALNHLGFRVETAAELLVHQRRLESLGISTSREDGVECCHALQTKFWVSDPDGNQWEFYILEADVEPEPAETSARPMTSADVAAARSWEHLLGTPFPPSLPLADGEADHVLLRGTFNASMDDVEQQRILRDAYRALRQGGKLIVHGLVADGPIAGPPPRLPGPAAEVQHVPARSRILQAICDAGFVLARIERLSPAPVFSHAGVPLRELLVEAIKRDRSNFELLQRVVYKGPFQQVSDEAGNLFARGVTISVPGSVVDALRLAGLDQAFAVLTS